MRRVALRGAITRPWWRARLGQFGEDSVLHRPDWLYGHRKISIGDRVLVWHGAWLSAERQSWEREGPAIAIGNDVGIRPYVTISAAESIVIEDNVVVAAFTSIVDSDHTFDRGRPHVMANPVLTAPIRVGFGTWIAERVAVLRGANIGRCCIIGANSVVRGDIPDFSIAAGAPARVVGSTRESFAENGA